jgi:hypothetical protein
MRAVILVVLMMLAGCARHDRSWGSSQARDMVDVDLAPKGAQK